MRQDEIDQKLEEALKRPLEVSMPADFSDRVLTKIHQREAAMDSSMKWVYGLAMSGFLLSGLICLVIFADKDSLALLPEIGLWGLLIGVMVMVFQWLDHKLVRKKTQLI